MIEPDHMTVDYIDTAYNITIGVLILLALAKIWEQDHRWRPVRGFMLWLLGATSLHWVGDAVFMMGLLSDEQRHEWHVLAVQPTFIMGLSWFIWRIEKTLHTHVHGPHIAIVCIDPQGMITHWNQAAERLLGWNEDEVVGRELAVVVVPESAREKHRQGVRELATNPHAQILERPLHVSSLTRSGTEMPVEIVITRHETPEGLTFMATVRENHHKSHVGP